ncbi:MAG: hypothetical protein SFU91_08690 [Chloroherpetonaceae bacterium]|nr:hypothetical protein [Chloroherpetonaceae bacterium]
MINNIRNRIRIFSMLLLFCMSLISIDCAIFGALEVMAQLGGKKKTTQTPSQTQTPSTSNPKPESQFQNQSSAGFRGVTENVSVSGGESVTISNVNTGENPDYVVIRYNIPSSNSDQEYEINAYQLSGPPDSNPDRRKLDYVRGTGTGLFASYGAERVIAWNLRADTSSNSRAREYYQRNNRFYVQITAEEAGGGGFFSTVLFLGLIGGAVAWFIGGQDKDQSVPTIPAPSGTRPPTL